MKIIHVTATFFFTIVLLLLLATMGTSAQNEISFDYFVQEDGLPNNHIQCIYQDQKAWIWVGTNQGISRFDGYEFINFQHSTEDSLSLNGSLVRVIFEDREGRILVGTEHGGLNVYDREQEVFRHPYEKHEVFKGKDISINSIQQDEYGKLWLGTNTNIITIDTLGNISEFSVAINNAPNEKEGEFVRVLQFDNLGKLWVGTNRGVFVLDPKSNKIELLELPFGDGGADEILELFLDVQGNMWIGTYSHGAYFVDPVSREIKEVKLNPALSRTQTVRSISVGAYGNYWIGTRGGLYVYNKESGISDFYNHDDRELTSLINNSVLDVLHDRQGDTWIGTRGGLNLLAKSKQIFHNYRAHASALDNKYLNSSIVYAFWIDLEDNIWVGTEDGGINIYHPKTESYSYLTSDEENPNSISNNCIKAFLDDKKGNLWIGTFLGGINVFNLETEKITHYTNDPTNPSSLSDDKVWDFLLDDTGVIWVATSVGVDLFNPENQTFTHYPQLAGRNQVNWIEKDSQNHIWLGTADEVIIYNLQNKKIVRFSEHSRAFLEDSQGRYWITTLDRGIAQYDKIQGAIEYFSKDNGLANNQALCILEDDLQKLWVSTSNGLSKFDPQTKLFQNYSSKDGLRNNQFTYGAAYKSREGELLFGGISGFNVFNPSEVSNSDVDVPLILTELRVFNKKVGIEDSEKAILKKSISETEHLVLEYDQNVFTLEFAALNFVNSKKNQYCYFLEGFDKEWSDPSTTRSATYTNLNPDDYVFHIKRVIQGGLETEPELRVLITVLPPFWKTIWFRVLMLAVIGVLIYLLIQFLLFREKIKNELVFERLKARKLHELDMLKLKFFTNISHEIRTPLTLILAPLEKLIHNDLPKQDLKSHLDIMYRNTRHLDRLINQLLDFRKLESGKLKLELLQGDIVHFVSDIVGSFDSYAKEKEIDLSFNTLKDKLTASFDPDKLEKIINNLLSNAFKFTEKGGKITVNLSLVFASKGDELARDEEDRESVEITVRDTGQGISESNTSNIFNRFFQVNEREEQTGTGIGLAFVKELVKLHNGQIFVTSKPGVGSKFTFHIPYLKESESVSLDNEIDKMAKEKLVVPGSLDELSNIPMQSKILLIVEDNPDVRTLIKSHFESSYQVVEAADGKQGWKMALELLPDVIISDVLMPELNGYELCKKVKNDERTSHIPVLLLTALHSKDHEIKGLSSGADDYITKPFDLSILQTKIDNMLAVRFSLKEKYSAEITLQPKNILITSPEEKFLQKAVEVVELHIENSDLDIEQFAREVGVSRMQLYRKLHALTDMTVKEFIRSIRLKRAAQLLVQEKMTISEIAYAVGFKDLSHFRKCFKQIHGMTASEYMQKFSK